MVEAVEGTTQWWQSSCCATARATSDARGIFSLRGVPDRNLKIDWLEVVGPVDRREQPAGSEWLLDGPLFVSQPCFSWMNRCQTWMPNYA